MEEDELDRVKENHNLLVFSYLTLRNLIGFSGILLPFVLIGTTVIGEDEYRIAPSISDYYYTSNGDVLVVVLCVLGVFLLTYKGYTRNERILTSIAAVSAIGVAFSPTSASSVSAASIHVTNETIPYFFGVQLHLIFAALFLTSLALIALVYFPRSRHPVIPVNSQKYKRNRIYRISGWLMVGSLLLIVAYFVLNPEWLKGVPVVFILEAVAVEAFGLAWITKGETLWPDGEHYIQRAYRAWLSRVT